jgi:cell division septation protein DedD
MVSIGKQWRESQQAHQVAKWTAVIVFAAVVVVSGISTIIYIKETKEPPEAVSAPAKPEPQIATSGRYTVQAASFRNRQQAVKFAEQIKNRGYPAYFGESRSSEQNIWYYVRISRFENKQEAKEFAEDLKGKGVIDDFYIANYKEP